MKKLYRCWDADFMDTYSGQLLSAESPEEAASLYAIDVAATRRDVIAVLDLAGSDTSFFEVQSDNSLEEVNPCDPEI